MSLSRSSAIGRSATALAAALVATIVWTKVVAQPAQTGGASAHGKLIYDQRCAACHGVTGRGDGPAAALLAPRPRDFGTGKFKIRTTNTGSLPTDEDLIRSVRDGLPGSAMSGWGALLGEPDIREVVEYVKSFSPRFKEDAAPQLVAIGDSVPSSPDSVARGGVVYQRLQCGKCHGDDGRGTGGVATTFEDDWRQPLTAANLAEPWTFRGGSTARDVYLRLRTGMSGTPMPSFADTAGDGNLWDLANYVVSLARKPVWSMTAQEVAGFYAQREADAKAHPVQRGKALVDTLACALCHSPFDEEGRILPGMKFAGGLTIRIDPFGDFPTGNLTSDKETGLGAWTDDDIKRVLTRGTLRDGSRLLPFPMDWPSFSTMTPDDLNAVVAYLRTIPPIRNRVPPISRPLLPIYLWGKFKMLILQTDPPMTFFAGNAGGTGGNR